MTEQQGKLDITPRVIDLGDRVIQLQHVVSVGRHALYPFRALGVLFVVAGAGLVGNELAMRGLQAFKLQSAGSLPLWLGFGAAGIGLFFLLYAKRVLMIRTSDGGRVELPASSDEASAALILRIRNAMEEPAFGVPGRSAPMTAALPGSGSSQPAIAWSGAPAGSPQQLPQSQRPQITADPGTPQTTPVGRRGEPYANGHAGRSPFGGVPPEGMQAGDPAAGAYRRARTSQALPQGLGMGPPERRMAGAEPIALGAAREPLALPATLPAGLVRDDGLHELMALMEHVRRADVQHKEALLDLLKVVDDHYRGRATREDAIAHWRSFADYVVQYLGDVDGLIAHTERFGRFMVAR